MVIPHDTVYSSASIVVTGLRAGHPSLISGRSRIFALATASRSTCWTPSLLCSSRGHFPL